MITFIIIVIRAREYFHLISTICWLIHVFLLSFPRSPTRHFFIFIKLLWNMVRIDVHTCQGFIYFERLLRNDVDQSFLYKNALIKTDAVIEWIFVA